MIADSDSAHSCCKANPGFGSMYRRPAPARLCPDGRSFVGQLRQYAVASLLAYVTVQGVHRRFVQISVPSIGTAIEAFRLICARLQFHVSGASKPRLASSASAGNSGCSLRGNASSLTTSLRPCIGSCCSCSA